MSYDALAFRMKGYENETRFSLEPKQPVIIRLDGKAFHTFTRGMVRPFDEVLHKSMQDAAIYLCENVQGCKLAYTQSDEISLLLVDYDTEKSQPWFQNGIQKMVSVAASMATLAFNRAFRENVIKWSNESIRCGALSADDYSRLVDLYSSRFDTALFDARVFVLPRGDVCNYFIWRQQDAVRNSVQMIAQSLYSHKELMGKSCEALKEMIRERGLDWDDYPTVYKRGACIVRETYMKGDVQRSRWSVDFDIPVFTLDRCYIDKFVFINN